MYDARYSEVEGEEYVTLYSLSQNSVLAAVPFKCGAGPSYEEVFSVHLCPLVHMLVTLYTPFFRFCFTVVLFWVLDLPKFLFIWHLSLPCKRFFFFIHKHVSLILPSFLAVFVPLDHFFVSNFLILHKNTISAVCNLLASCHLYLCFCYHVNKNVLLVHMQSSQMNTFWYCPPKRTISNFLYISHLFLARFVFHPSHHPWLDHLHNI